MAIGRWSHTHFSRWPSNNPCTLENIQCAYRPYEQQCVASKLSLKMLQTTLRCHESASEAPVARGRRRRAHEGNQRQRTTSLFLTIVFWKWWFALLLYDYYQWIDIHHRRRIENLKWRSFTQTKAILTSDYLMIMATSTTAIAMMKETKNALE